jgi:hypothetical protein
MIDLTIWVTCSILPSDFPPALPTSIHSRFYPAFNFYFRPISPHPHLVSC